MVTSTKQDAARKRNWAKAQLFSMDAQCKAIANAAPTTDWEKLKLRELQSILYTLKRAWDGESKELGFNVRSRSILDE